MKPVDPYRRFKRVAVLGTGIMGAQIAAHLTNCGVQVTLFGLTEEEDVDATAERAITGLARSKPPALGLPEWAQHIQPATYTNDLALIAECALVIEAVSEDRRIKNRVYKQILPHLNNNAILASNTSGLSIAEMGKWMPAKVRDRFFGVHFFNPPRFMPLVELIAPNHIDQEIATGLDDFLTSAVGKQVVRAKDAPGFIANRLGMFAMTSAIHHAERLGIGFDTVDALCGERIGRAKSACFRTADLIGLDIVQAVINNLHDALKHDPWQNYFQVPDWMKQLIEEEKLGQKSGVGVYKKEGKEILVFDKEQQDYRPASKEVSKVFKQKIKEAGGVAAALPALQSAQDVESQFIWAIHRDLFHYAAVHLADLADTVREADLAMRYGFGWRHGIFSLWQQAGGQALTQQIARDIKSGAAMSDMELPPWIDRSFYAADGAWSPSARKYVAALARPRDLAPQVMKLDRTPQLKIVSEDDYLRAVDLGDDILAVNFKTKMHVISYEVLDGLVAIYDRAVREYGALIIWQEDAPFCAGANLYQILASAKLGAYEKSGIITNLKRQAFESLNPKLPKIGKLPPIREILMCMQNLYMRFKHGDIPVVAAVQGLALGGGCELLLHCDRVVATQDSFIGLVEIAVGVLPAAGGSKEMARRAEELADDTPLFPVLAKFYKQIALAKISSSAAEARKMGYLRAPDKIIANPQELLYVARNEAYALMRGNYRPPRRRKDIKILGRAGKANFLAQLTNLQAGQFISDHDYLCAAQTAEVLCGGELDADQVVSDDWLLQLECAAFLRLLKTPASQQRIEHILKTGKPLRN